MNKSIEQQMVRGALWMVLFKLVERSCGFGSTLILVRLLSPADFGVVGMALSFVFIAELLTAFGFDVALIQRRDLTDEHYHTAWTCNVLVGVVIGALMVVSAGAIASFYKQPQLFWVVCALALGPVISGCENIGVIAFRKDMQFRREFTFQLSRKILGVLVVVPLAYFLRNYWALVAGILTAKLTGTVISYRMHPFRPRFSLTKVRGLLGFSKWLLFGNIVGTLKERSSDFFIGRMLGAPSLGVYNVSSEIAAMPTTELSAPINRALLPGFSRIAHDPVAMRAAYGNAIAMLTFIAVPAAAGIASLAPFIVPTLLGTKWLAGVPLMQILALNGSLMFIHSSICAMLIANGHPDRVTKTNGLYLVMLLALFGVLIPAYGLPGAAFAVLAASILTTPVFLFQARRSIGVPASLFLGVMVRPLTAALVMAGAVRWLLPDWSPALHLVASVAWMIGGIALGVTAYTIVILALWFAAGRPGGAERVLVDQFRQRLAGRRATPASVLS
jgi:O-antigen/teichoic acid export membrane protein